MRFSRFRIVLICESGILDLWDEAVEAIGFSKDDLLPIAATKNNMDMFLLAKPFSKNPGLVIWFAAYEIE